MESADLTGAVLDGRYKVLEAVAEGAMGVVYRAERLKLGKIVAIKVLHDELPNELSSRKRFEIEATAMAKLEHPNCAAVLDVGTHEGRPFVVMDFISGQDLKGLVDQGPLPTARAVDIVKQVLSGIAHAHELGIIHRDIKPANIILSQKTGLGDHVKILDFGLARLQAEQTSKLTTGIVVGTPAYMSPEQIRGNEIDTRADLYACGVLLFELVTGKKPFHSEKDDPIEVVQMHLKTPPPRMDAVLAGAQLGELEAVVAKALAKSPSDRFQTAAEFAAALDAAARKLTSSVALAATEPAGQTITDSQAMQISESMMIKPGETLMALATVPPAPAPAPDLFAPSAEPAHQPAKPVDASFVPSVSSQSVLVPPPIAEHDPHAPITPPRPRTEPAAAAPTTHPFGLPFTRKQLQLGGGILGAMLLIGIIAKCSSGGAPSKAPETAKPTDDPAEIEMAGTTADGADKILARADQLVERGNHEAALSLLDKSASAFPDNAQIPYRAGKLYFAKLWWTDGVRHFRNVVSIDPGFKSDPELIKIVLKGFITTPDYNDELADLLLDLGPVAQQYLEETARDHPNANIRARAKSELRRYR